MAVILRFEGDADVAPGWMAMTAACRPIRRANATRCGLPGSDVRVVVADVSPTGSAAEAGSPSRESEAVFAVVAMQRICRHEFWPCRAVSR